MFSLGVILFVLKAGFSPFKMAHSTDEHYRRIWELDYDTFWERNRFATPELADLISRMISALPELRISLADIVCHPWLTRDG